MCVKLPPGDLNPNLYLSHLTSTYTYGVTTNQEWVVIINYNLLKWIILFKFSPIYNKSHNLK